MRCYKCNASSQGLSDVPWKQNRKFFYCDEPGKEHLDICSDCKYTYVPDTEYEEGEVDLVENDWDG